MTSTASAAKPPPPLVRNTQMARANAQPHGEKHSANPPVQPHVDRGDSEEAGEMLAHILVYSTTLRRYCQVQFMSICPLRATWLAFVARTLCYVAMNRVD